MIDRAALWSACGKAKHVVDRDRGDPDLVSTCGGNRVAACRHECSALRRPLHDLRAQGIGQIAVWRGVLASVEVLEVNREWDPAAACGLRGGSQRARRSAINKVRRLLENGIDELAMDSGEGGR